MKHIKTIIKYTSFLGYLVFLFWLLFGFRILSLPNLLATNDYWRIIHNKINLIPFYTIIKFIGDIKTSPETSGTAIINIIGNIVGFIPLGYYITSIFLKNKTILNIIKYTIITILIIEIIQLFTLLGHFDIDDIILNTIGSIFGFILYKISYNNSK